MEETSGAENTSRLFRTVPAKSRCNGDCLCRLFTVAGELDGKADEDEEHRGLRGGHRVDGVADEAERGHGLASCRPATTQPSIRHVAA